ncbi:11670_t:CDS:10, partial [Funneliformis caledonium]
TPRDDNPFLLSNENISDKFEKVTGSGNLDEERNEKSVVTPRRDDNPFLLSNENISDKFEIVTKSGNLNKEHNKKNIISTLPPLPRSDDVHTPNKRLMYDEKVICYLNAMGQSLEYNRIHVQAPPMWTKESGEAFKEAIMQKIKGDNDNKFRLYCEKILMDFYNLVDVFPTLSRKIGERKYIVQNLSSLFKFYETTFGNITIDWIESHSLSAKLSKSPTSSGIVKLDAKGVRSFDDKEIWHMEVSGPPSSPTTDHAVALLLDHLDVPLKTAMNIKVFSLQAIGYRITLYSLSMREDGSFLATELASAVIPFSFEGRSKYKAVLYLMVLFHDEFMKQLSIMQELDFTINYGGRDTVRNVLKIPKSLQDLLKWRQYY